MSTNDVAILIACISGVVSLAAAFGVEWLRQRSNRTKRKQDQVLADLKFAQSKELEKFRHEGALALEEAKDRLTQGREAATKAEEATRLIARYRDPLLQSAFDLQSRIYNVYRPGGFRGYRDPEYFRLNTLFLFGEFLGWLEIIRREIRFLDLGAVQATKDLTRVLQEIQDQLATTSELRDEFYLYRGQQRAIGELMLLRADEQVPAGPRYECIGYATFVAAYENPEFAKWFTRLGTAIDQLRGTKPERLVWVQHGLINLINLLDPGCDRFEQNRDPLPEPESPQRRPSRRPNVMAPRTPGP